MCQFQMQKVCCYDIRRGYRFFPIPYSCRQAVMFASLRSLLFRLYFFITLWRILCRIGLTLTKHWSDEKRKTTYGTRIAAIFKR